MEKLDINDVSQFVENNIEDFHKQKFENLKKLKLSAVLKRKNPYLFKAKNMTTAADIVKSIVDAHISSSEETIFDEWLEKLAIFISGKVFYGKKSSAQGIDLEFDNENIRYIVSIKSGSNWGNSSQIKKLVADFNSAKRTLKTSNSKINVIAVNGCCYGIDNKPYKKDDYYKYCGQRFWNFISGTELLYLDIIKPLGYHAKLRNEEFLEKYSQILNIFTLEFAKSFCTTDGSISWNTLLQCNSGMNPIPKEETCTTL